MSSNILRDVFDRRFLQRDSQASWIQAANKMEDHRALLQPFPTNGDIPCTSSHLPAFIMPRFLAKARTICSNVKSLPKNYGSRNQPIDAVALLSSYPYSSATAQVDDDRCVGNRFLKSRCSEPNLKVFQYLNPNFLESFPIKSSDSRMCRSIFTGQNIRKYYGFLEPIPSIGSPEFKTMIHDSSLKRPTADFLDFNTQPFVSTQNHYNANLNKQMRRQSHSLEADDQINNVQYESDKKFRHCSDKVRSEKRYSRKKLQLHFKGGNLSYIRKKSRDNSEPIESITEDFRLKIQLSPQPCESSSDCSFKGKLNKKVVSPKISKNLSKEKSTNVFERCRSSATSNDVTSLVHDDEEEMVDEVFDNPIARKTKPLNETNKKLTKSVLSNLEALPAKKLHKTIKKRISSVSIEENPEIADHKTPTKSSKIASSNCIANSNAKPSLGFLKKSSNKQPTSSDYDRDRGRSRHIDSGHRESFKKNDRTNERGSDQDRDASDREHKGGSLNRSLSNTDPNLEDRIGLNDDPLTNSQTSYNQNYFRWQLK